MEYVGILLAIRVVVMGRCRRGEVEVIQDVLRVALGGASKTRIVYGANLNFVRASKYLGRLEGWGFIARVDDPDGRVVYKTTEDGRGFLNRTLKGRGLRAKSLR